MDRRLRIVLVHRYFVPDTPPYAHMLSVIAETLAARGHDVQVLTCQPSYRRAIVGQAPRREAVNGVSVTRFPVLDDRQSTAKKVLNLLWFAFRLATARKAFRGADVVMAGTTPPVAIAALCSLLARARGAAFVYHKQDIWPEVSGRSGLTASVLRRMDHGTEARAALVVVLSSDMAETVKARGRAPARIEVLNNFDPWPAPERVADEHVRSPRAGISLVFAGNLGRFQGLEHLAEVIRRTGDASRTKWHFFGDGPMRPMLERLGTPVVMHGHQPAEVVADFVATQADLGIVSLNHDVIRAAYPSKTMTYLRNGCPVLALVESDSELAEMIRNERIGITGPQDDPATIVAGLERLAASRDELEAARERSRSVYVKRFDSARVLPRWVSLLEATAR